MSLLNRMASLSIRRAKQSNASARTGTGVGISSRIGNTLVATSKQNAGACFQPISHLTTLAKAGSVNPTFLKSECGSQPQSKDLIQHKYQLSTWNKSKFIKDDKSVIAIGPDGSKYLIPHQPLGGYKQPRHAPKLKPRIVTSRTSKLRTVDAAHKNIRHSPWRLNLVCQFAARETTTVTDAVEQLKFVRKVKAPLVAALIHTAANTAKQRYGLLPSQLEVVECFATHGTHLKRIKPMGRGRAGTMHHRFSHMRVVLREIDFPLKIIQCKSVNQRNKWVKKMEIALDESEAYRTEMEELEKLESEVEEMQKKKAEEEK